MVLFILYLYFEQEVGESSLKAESSSGMSSQKFGNDDEETGGVYLEFSTEQSIDIEVHDVVAGFFNTNFSKKMLLPIGSNYYKKVDTSIWLP